MTYTAPVVTYEVIEPNGRDFVRDASCPYAVVRRSTWNGKKHVQVVGRYADKACATRRVRHLNLWL